MGPSFCLFILDLPDCSAIRSKAPGRTQVAPVLT